MIRWKIQMFYMVVIAVVVACGGADESDESQPVNGDASHVAVKPVARPNILFISIDDLNDWIEPLGGHPQAVTPNLTALAESGVNFSRAYTASPACNPSRMALLSGRHTYRTGMYSNYQKWKEVMPDVQTLPEYFAEHGYWTVGRTSTSSCKGCVLSCPVDSQLRQRCDLAQRPAGPLRS